jgi:hypothetical protein
VEADAARFDGQLLVGVAPGGGGPNGGEYFLAGTKSGGLDKVYLGVGGGNAISDTTPRYYVAVNPQATSIATNPTDLYTVHIGSQTYDCGGVARTGFGLVGGLYVAAPNIVNGSLSGGIYSIFASGAARIDGGLVCNAGGATPLEIFANGDILIGDASHALFLNVPTSTTNSGGAFAMPTGCEGFLVVTVGNTPVKIPFCRS